MVILMIALTWVWTSLKMDRKKAKGFDTAKDLLVDLLKVKDKQSDNKSMSTVYCD